MSMPGDDYALGSQPDLPQLNAQLGQDAMSVQSVMVVVLRRWRFISKVGVAGLQGPPWNLPPGKAQEMFTAFNHMATVAQVYFGEAAQPDQFNFDDALALYRGGG